MGAPLASVCHCFIQNSAVGADYCANRIGESMCTRVSFAGKIVPVVEEKGTTREVLNKQVLRLAICEFPFRMSGVVNSLREI
jgi:hypothetical protein